MRSDLEWQSRDKGRCLRETKAPNYEHQDAEHVSPSAPPAVVDQLAAQFQSDVLRPPMARPMRSPHRQPARDATYKSVDRQVALGQRAAGWRGTYSALWVATCGHTARLAA